MSEEGRKVDLRLSIAHAHQGTSISVLCQIKSGAAYRAPTSTQTTLTLQNIDRDTIAALGDGGGPTLLAWVPPRPSARIYYHLFHTGRNKKTPIRIPKTQHVTPALRFDLSKVSSYVTNKPKYSRQDVAQLREDTIMQRARRAYKELKIAIFDTPLFGHLHVTRAGWRHVTRRSRAKARRVVSLRTTPHLAHFLPQIPSRYLIVPQDVRRLGGTTTEIRDVICWYLNGIFMDGARHTLLIRFREQISYPTKWYLHPLAETDIKQRASVLSWWCRKEQ